MSLQDMYIEHDMLRGNLNRMFLADDVNELITMHEFAKKRLEKIYEYHYARLTSAAKDNT